MSKRWLATLALAILVPECTLVTDFGGVADGTGASAGSSGQGGSSGAAGSGPGFPRLAAFETANPKDFDDPAHQQDVARLDISIMGIYPGWEDSHGPVQQVALNVKALNPNTLLFVTISPESFPDTTSGNAYQEVIDRLHDLNWWLYSSGSSGSIVAAPYPNEYLANTTLFTPPDADGHGFVEWFARWSVKTYTTPNPGLDGLLVDDLDDQPAADGDFNRDGTTDDRQSAEVGQWHRAGYRRLLDELRQLTPSKYLLGGIGALTRPGAVSTELEGVLHGGVLLDLIGRSFSTENTSWNGMMTEYRRALGIVIDPKLVVFHMDWTPGDYQSVRYGLASCLMDDGYFALSDVDTNFGIQWVDEMDADLGAAISPPPTLAWANGVYRRDFENGIALVNPRGNGAVTVSLETQFRRLSGTQDPLVNDGQTTDSVSLQERDGILLLRMAE